MAEPQRQRLERTIRVGGSALLSFNGVVGAAIFALPATLLVDWGAFSPWLFLIVGGAALLVIVPFTRSAAAFTESGGPATYGLVYGPLAGFELGWVYYVARTAAFAANLNVLTDYLGWWWLPVQHGPGRFGTVLALCVVLTLVNLLGMRRALAFLSGFTILKALPLLIAGIVALVLFWPPPPPIPFAHTGSVEAGFLIVFYAFVGFENAVVPTGETEKPHSTIPRAVVTTTLLTALLYFVVQFGFVAAFRSTSPTSSTPLIDLGALVANQFGAIALTVAAICSLLGNLLACAASTPRVTYAMGTRGDLPEWFGAVSPTLKSPANSILFFAAVAVVLAVSGSFVWLAVVSTLARMFVYVLTIGALPLAPNRPALTALHWVSGAAGIAVCVWGMTQANSSAWLTLLALGIVGIVLFGFATMLANRATAAASA